MISVLERARAWVRDDPDPQDREELLALLSRVESGDQVAERELNDRFNGFLEFGTAGLRGVIGAGESRMNRAVVLRATWGLGQYLIATVPDARERGVIVGHDARLRSDVLARAACEVMLALGFRVTFVPGPNPTPLIGFGVKTLHAAAGIVITASHNPPEYNGYKVYLDRAAQIVPPHDAGIAAQIAVSPPARDVPRVAFDGGLVADGSGIVSQYVDAVLGLKVLDVPADRVRIAYTALHGVGEKLTRVVMDRAGFTDFHSVSEQAVPDGTFPTVRFPNPEEPGALDLALWLASKINADVVLAQDPDADRLAIAARDASGAYRVLSGNEIGVLLAHHVLVRDPDPSPDRLVITTVVSSAQLKRIAAELNVVYAETLTGFKWIANHSIDRELQDNLRFVFGYEEALGYTVGTVTRDKDGIGAALVAAECAALAKKEGKTLLDRLREIRERFGLYVSRQRSVVLPGREGAEKIRATMKSLRAAPPTRLGSFEIESCWDLLAQSSMNMRTGQNTDMKHLPASDVLVYDLSGGGRAAVRPSGTEPKVKLYLEVVEQLAAGASLEEAQRRGEAKLDELERTLLSAAGLGS